MNSNACRICLEISRRVKSIFKSQTSFDVPTFIREFCNVLILDDDEFSKKICQKCLDKIQMSYSLRQQCIESDRRLRSESKILEDEKFPTTKLLPSYRTLKIKCEEEWKESSFANSEESSALNLSIPQNLNSFTNLVGLSSKEIETSILADRDLKSNEYSEGEAKGLKDNVTKNHEKTHMCSVCGKTFFTAGHLRSHELTHNNSKDFTCHSCEKKFLTKSYLNRHMKSHLNERSYKCKVCQKGFNTSTSLGYHFRLVHSGETNYCCTFCSKGFPLKIQLISHTRSHSGEKPHKCNQCDKKYSHKIDLKRHMMLHTGNKPYKCPHCDRLFTKKSNMECHIPTHTGEKPYKCDVCLKEFRQPCPYKKHLQTHLKPNVGQIIHETLATDSLPAIS